MSIDILRNMFLWCSIINIVLFLLSAVIIISAHERIFKLHSKWFSLTEKDFNFTMYMMMAVHKILILIFNIIPFIALCIVA